MTSGRLESLLLVQEIAQFLYHEAELLDERRHDEWLALLSPDIRYWMPMRRNVKFGDDSREFTRETDDISWFDEGKDTLTRRVRQIQTGIHWAEEPRSRISHMVSNVQVLSVSGEEAAVKSRFLIAWLGNHFCESRGFRRIRSKACSYPPGFPATAKCKKHRLK